MKQVSQPLVRHLVLGGALLAALAIGPLPDGPTARAAMLAMPPIVVAQDSASGKEAAAAAREVAEAVREAMREARREIAEQAKAAERAAADAARSAQEAQADADAESQPRKGFNVSIDGADRHYDSFDQFLDRDPGLAFLVMGVVFLVFLTPILIIALVIWYKVRRNRMQNETMLKLAEKGIVPPVETLQTVGGGRADASLAHAASALPPAQRVQVLARRAAWSDLRKGIVMGAVGLALAVHGMMEDGQPGWFGLILLFVGLGYIALWYFEDRQTAETLDALRTSVPPPTRGPGLE